MENNDTNQQKHHEYDGIIEHNNPMPGWWLWTFILAVVFAFIYYLHYEVTGDGLTLKEELAISMAKIEKLKAESANTFPSLTEEELTAKLQDAKLVANGAGVYQAKCAMCHGDQLEGKIGPNLTDATWINGSGSASDIVKLVREGVPAKGMPPWEGLLKPDEIFSVVALIKSKTK